MTMTDRETQAWNAVVEWARKYHNDPDFDEQHTLVGISVILAADAELTRLRAIEQRAKDVEGAKRAVLKGREHYLSGGAATMIARALSAWIVEGI